MVVTHRRNGLAPPDGAHLLTPAEYASHPPDRLGGVVTLVPIDLLDANAHNPRQDMREVDALAQSIVEFGLLQPLLVRPAGDRYEVVAGHRRRAAYLKLHADNHADPRWQRVPAIVRQADDDSSYLMLISAQVHIVEWTQREQASALERLAAAGMTLRAIGEKFGRTESWASRRLRVFADDILSAHVQTGRLAPGTAEELLLVHDVEQRRELAERAVAEHWGQDQARQEVRSVRERDPFVAALKALEAADEHVFRLAGQPLPEGFERACRQLRRHLNELLAEPNTVMAA